MTASYQRLAELRLRYVLRVRSIHFLGQIMLHCVWLLKILSALVKPTCFLQDLTEEEGPCVHCLLL